MNLINDGHCDCLRCDHRDCLPLSHCCDYRCVRAMNKSCCYCYCCGVWLSCYHKTCCSNGLNALCCLPMSCVGCCVMMMSDNRCSCCRYYANLGVDRYIGHCCGLNRDEFRGHNHRCDRGEQDDMRPSRLDGVKVREHSPA